MKLEDHDTKPGYASLSSLDSREDIKDCQQFLFSEELSTRRLIFSAFKHTLCFHSENI